MNNYYYEDYIATERGRKLGELSWACQCKALPRQLKSGYSGLHATTVDAEGICLHCEHYAFRVEKRVLGLKKQQRRRPKGLVYNKTKKE